MVCFQLLYSNFHINVHSCIVLFIHFYCCLFITKVAARPASSSERKINRGAKGECSFQAPTISSYQKQANNNEHVICYKGVQNRTSETPSFVPPYGLPTTLRVTNKMNAVDVIGMLFKKFQVLPCFFVSLLSFLFCFVGCINNLFKLKETL